MEKHTTLQEPKTLWNKAFIIMLILNTLINSASQMVVPLVSKFATEELHTSLTLASTIASLMSLAAMFIRPISGMFNDRFSRKMIIIVSTCALGACVGLMPLCKTVAPVIVIRLIHGAAFSFNGVALMAFSTEFVPKSRMGEGVGWMSVSNIAAQAIGPNIGVMLLDAGGFSLCFSGAAIGCFISAGIFAFFPYKFERPESVNKFDINNLISVRLLPYAAILCLFSAGNGLAMALVVLFAEGRGIPNVELFFTATSITMVLIRVFFGKVGDQKGLRAVLYPAIAATSISFVVLANANALWVVVFAAVLKAMGQGVGMPAIQSNCLNQLGREKAGVASSTFFIGQDVGNSLAPMIGGFMAERFGYTAMFNGYAVIMLVVGMGIFAIKWNYDVKKYGYRA